MTQRVGSVGTLAGPLRGSSRRPNDLSSTVLKVENNRQNGLDPVPVRRTVASEGERSPDPVDMYVFGRDGSLLATRTSAGRPGIGPDQVRALLALTGGFAPSNERAHAHDGMGRVRFDALDVVSVRGTRGIVAAAYRTSPTEETVLELRRVLDRLERRWPSPASDARGAERVAARAARVLPRALRTSERTPFRAAAVLASVFGVFSRTR